MSMVSPSTQARTYAQSFGRILVCAALTALGARVAMRLPFTPVPVTWQVAAVVFSGLVLGTREAFSAQALYLLTGMAGAPVFAFGNGGAAYLFNHYGTGGYLLSFPLASALVSLLAHTQSAKSRKAPFLACLSGIAVIYGIGCLWLGCWLHLPVTQALMQGTGWFLAWDAVKGLVAVIAARGVQQMEPR